MESEALDDACNKERGHPARIFLSRVMLAIVHDSLLSIESEALDDESLPKFKKK